jgi:hypothetical protein
MSRVEISVDAHASGMASREPGSYLCDTVLPGDDDKVDDDKDDKNNQSHKIVASHHKLAKGPNDMAGSQRPFVPVE